MPLTVSTRTPESDLDFRQPMRSRIEEIRADHSNPLTTLGESFDNSYGWGKATIFKVEIVLNTDAEPDQLFIIDNGRWCGNKERFSKMLCLGGEKNRVVKDRQHKKYSEQKSTIGRFKLGVPKGGIVSSNKQSHYHMINGELMKTTNNWQKAVKNNRAKPKTIVVSKQEERELYNKYCSNGGMLSIYSHLREITRKKLSKDKVINYFKLLHVDIGTKIKVFVDDEEVKFYDITGK